MLGLTGIADPNAAQTDVGHTGPDPVGRIVRRVR